MSRRYLPLVVVLTSVLTAAGYWRVTEPDPTAAPYRILRVAVSSSGRWIGVASATGWIGIIDQTQPDSPQRFRAGAGELRDLRFTRDERWLVVTNDASARHSVLSLGASEQVGPTDDHGEPQTGPTSVPFAHASNVAATPAGALVSGNHAGSVEVHDRSGKLIRRFVFR